MSSIGPVVSEEKMFENVDGRRTTDGRTPDAGRRSHWYTISSPMSLRLRWANKYRGKIGGATNTMWIKTILTQYRTSPLFSQGPQETVAFQGLIFLEHNGMIFWWNGLSALQVISEKNIVKFGIITFCLKGIYLSKALTCMKIFLYKHELLLCQGDR